MIDHFGFRFVRVLCYEFDVLQNKALEVNMSKMVDQPEDYFRSLIPPRDELMIELEAQAERENIPIVGPVVGELLYILAAATKAKRILELGTATGYSAIYLAKACEPVNGLVVTLENDGDMAARAQQNFQQAGVSERIEIHVANALDALPQLQESFDFIFMDIEKQDYIKVLSDCQRLLIIGGLLVADNVGFKDADEFNHTISGHKDWKSIPLFSFLPLHSPEHDALCLALRS
jgi:predicted O-methyltransferase YrrM